MEYRAFRAESVTEGADGTLHGLVAPYNVRTQIGGETYGFQEEIAPGTFTKSVSERDIVMLDNHDTHRPLARKSAGTLTFGDTPEGLRCDAKPPETSYAVDLRKNVKAGNYGGMSFGFEVVKDEWRDAAGNPSNRFEGTHRTLREVKLIEVSPVTFPAYQTTQIQARDSVLAEREAHERKAPEPEPEPFICSNCRKAQEVPAGDGREQEPESSTPENDAEALDIWRQTKRHNHRAARNRMDELN